MRKIEVWDFGGLQCTSLVFLEVESCICALPVSGHLNILICPLWVLLPKDCKLLCTEGKLHFYA
jgi:hypothetical protein